MKMLKKVLTGVLLAVLLAGLLFAGYVFYVWELEATEVYRQPSPDQKHQVVVYEVGAPGWPFGPVEARIKVTNGKGRTVNTLDCLLNNDGGGLVKEQILAIRWFETKVEVDIKAADDPSATTYCLPLD